MSSRCRRPRTWTKPGTAQAGVVLVVSLVSLGAIEGQQTPAPAAHSTRPYSSPIVFQRFEDPDVDPIRPIRPGLKSGGSIWIMEADGSRLQLLRADAQRHLDHPSLTEDLNFVLYAEFSPGTTKAQGSRARLLKESIGLQSDGTPLRRVVRNVPSCAVHHASLSPLTEELTYMRHCDEAPVALISEMDYELRDVTRVVAGRHAANGVGLVNGVVFQSEGPSENGQRRAAIAVVHYSEDGVASVRELTDRRFLHRRPAVSPDGEWVAWQSNDSDAGTDDLFLARIDGTEVQRLTRSEANDGHPWFSRDGRAIVFESDRTGNWEIFKLDRERGTVVQLTDDPGQVSMRPRF